MTTGLEVMARFEQFAAPAWAEDWDHVGWQLGDPTRAVRRMLITLDVRPAVVDEAIDAGVDLIFSHHPLMFRPATKCNVCQALGPWNYCLFGAYELGFSPGRDE